MSVNRFKSEEYRTGKKERRAAFLPDEFDKRMCDFVSASAIAQMIRFQGQGHRDGKQSPHSLVGTIYLEKFKDKTLGSNSYYNGLIDEGLQTCAGHRYYQVFESGSLSDSKEHQKVVRP